MSEYNKRQFRNMLEQIQQYETHTIDLKHLIKGLKSLLRTLENIDASWKSEFLNQWEVLEQTYAVALDRGREVSAQENKNIATAIQKIKHSLIEPCTPTNSPRANRQP